MQWYRVIWNKVVPYKIRKSINLGARLKIDPDLKTMLLEKYKDCNDGEMLDVIDLLPSDTNTAFVGDFVGKYDDISIEINRDKDGFPYTTYAGKRMYLKKDFTDDYAGRYVKSLLIEQDIESPHRYVDNDFYVGEGDVIFDLGGAEGIFSLEHIESAKEVHIFECDKEWVEALKKTFEPYGEKVHIVEMFVSRKSDLDSKSIKIDDYVAKSNVHPDFIKMDIEGAEVEAIIGAEELIKNSSSLKMVVCTYHRENDFDTLKTMLGKRFAIRHNEGYMIYRNYSGDGKPYLARGVIKCTLKKQ